ncbi:ribonucleotide reductase N-terminal alpha domain-containing protein [Caldivirga sp. UBA161]|uniref:ribonucleotide reductase N-terminal alpha domain-containing protein n=1 Tax=Caldivirga sp. UBA161 TaxID=1915569 RepID=UPI0025BF6DE5|nr:ribonucleotide reductase N-terminal alpha domain-containing protein [Caldivirga sp. UBA161]
MEQKVAGEGAMITIIKRNGVREEFNPGKLLNSLKLAEAPNPERILEELTNQIKGKGEVTSSEISDSVQLMMLNLISEDFKWHDAARNYLLFSIYKQVWGKEVIKRVNSGLLTLSEAYRRGFRDWFNQGLNQGLWSPEAAKFYEKYLEELMNQLDPSRDLLLTYNGVRTLMSRYLMKRLDGSFFEAPQYMWMRIAMGVAYSEVKYGNDPINWVREFYDLVSQLKFLPNSPTMFNSLTKLGELSACFVIPVDDCLSKDSNRDNPNCFFGIMDAAKLAALLFQAGAGVGYQFGELRPEGDVVKSTSGVASGPLSFMRLFDTLVDVIKQGGKRRGAQMGMLFWWHPDVEKFITSKTGKLKDVQLQNFNISVTIDDYFMAKALKGEDVYLLNPRECACLYQTWGQEFVKCYEECVSKVKAGLVKVWRRVNAGELWGKIVESAWDSGDPGLWNKDVANSKIEFINNSVSSKYSVINATNPCVTGDTRILTKYGYLQIGKLVKEGVNEVDLILPGQALVIHAATHGNKAVAIGMPVVIRSRVFSQGIKPIYKVITEEGYELRATPDHRLIVVTRDQCNCDEAPPEVQEVIKASLSSRTSGYRIMWKRVDQLRPGDLIYMSRIDIDKLGRGFGSSSIGEDLAFLLGWLVGGGLLYKYRGRDYGFAAWYFNARKEEVTQVITDILRYRFPNAKISTYYSKGEVKVLTSSRDVWGYFSKIAPELINVGSANRVIPELVYTLKPSEIKSFLRGLFTAGGAANADSVVRLTSASLRLLKQVQELLLLFGIMSTIYEGRAGSNHELVIKDYSGKLFIEKIGFADRVKAIKASLKKVKADPPLATVKNIEYLGAEEVFDTTVPGYHYYVAGGFISHNCGEVALYPFESCNLGSINLTRYVKDGSIDWEALAKDVVLAVRFLDDVIDANQHPHEYLDRANKASRRIGLGINGWADVLVSLDIPYDSPKAIALADVVMGFVTRVAVRASVELAKEKGPFPLWPSSRWRGGFLPWRVHEERVSKMLEVKGVSSDVEEYLDILKLGYSELGSLPNKAEEFLAKLRATDDELIRDASTVGVRNGALISIAPEGSRSLIAGVNSSIEPIFAIAYVRNLSIGKLIEYNYTALRKLKDSNALDNETISKVLEAGMLPSNHVMHPLLKTANEIHWRWHVFMQATFAKWSDSGVSKTINMPSNATREDVDGAYRLAWALGAFGITVYRDKSKSVQVIYTGVERKSKAQSTEPKAIKVTVKAINLNKEIEENKLEEIGETDDPACRTGVCG